MADLLECLLQIKGLRETAGRLRALIDGIPPRGEPAVKHGPAVHELIRDLAESERRHGHWLRSILSATEQLSDPADNVRDGPPLDVRAALERFLGRRRDNLEILDRCSAQDLSRSAIHGWRRRLTIADLVAVMLANDTETLGRIREALGGYR